MPNWIFPEDVEVWHGGAPGLKVGDYILPAGETGAKDRGVWAQAERDLAVYKWDERHEPRRDLVYLSILRPVALEFAVAHVSRKGQLYLCRPERPIKPDPDNYDGTSWTAPRALILAVFPIGKKTRRLVIDQLRARNDGWRMAMSAPMLDRIDQITKHVPRVLIDLPRRK